MPVVLEASGEAGRLASLCLGIPSQITIYKVNRSMMAYSIDGATDGAIQDILCRHTQNYRSGAFWDFRPPHFEGVWRVPIYIGPPEWNVGESRDALLKS